MSSTHAKELRAEGKKFLNAFGLQGAIWFAESVSFEDARVKWGEMMEKEFRQLTLKIGPHAARFAAEEVTFKAEPELTQFESGAVRGVEIDDVRYDLISQIGLRRLAETYAEGSRKYSDRNWEKGIPASNLINHTLHHIQQWLNGDSNEDHLAHAAWGLFAIMHFEAVNPKMIDIPQGFKDG